MTQRIACAIALALVATTCASLPVSAQREPTPGSVRAVRSTVESALRVTGTIDVDAAGTVVAWSLDQPEKLPPEVVRMAEANVPKWLFEPVTLPEGTPASRMRMSMLFVAREMPDGTHRVALRHPSFNPLDGPWFTVAKRGRRTYPPAAVAYNVTGTVFIALRIHRSGKVSDAMVEQVNLNVVDRERTLDAFRNLLGDAALDTARKTQFNAPEALFPPGVDERVARMMFVFRTETSPAPGYGEWSTYVPGPRTEIPWREASDLADTAPDALPPDVTQVSNSGIRRLRTSRSP